jgi:hypothetical protein
MVMGSSHAGTTSLYALMSTLTQCQTKNLKFKESYTLWQWTSYMHESTT